MPIPPSHSEARYGEPWRARYLTTGDLPLIEASNGQALQQGFWSKESRGSTIRAIQCVNACKGITDPAEALKLAREALSWAAPLAKQCGQFHIYDFCKNALDQLSPP